MTTRIFWLPRDPPHITWYSLLGGGEGEGEGVGVEKVVWPVMHTVILLKTSVAVWMSLKPKSLANNTNYAIRKKM